MSNNSVNVTLEDAEKIEQLPEEAKQSEPALDPAAFEAQMVEEERKRLEAEPDPVEIASMMLTLYTPRFCALTDGLSNRQLKRLVKSIVEFPVGKTYAHTNPAEKEAFAIAKNLLDAKYVLIANTYNENREKIMAEARKAAEEATMEYNKSEEQNNQSNEGNNNV